MHLLIVLLLLSGADGLLFLAVAPSQLNRARTTRYGRRSCTKLSADTRAHCDGLIIGLNKYSHDSSVCVLSARDGSCLFAGEKERLTRVKHDGGDSAGLIAHALASVDATTDDVRLVVSNNHHHRIAPFERRIPWAVSMGVYPSSYAAVENLLPGATHAELSHHLAHAWSSAALAPFQRGLIIVMDGMGESYGAMAKAEAAAQRGEGEGYYHDLRLLRELKADVGPEGLPGFQQSPARLRDEEAYREAESAYIFRASKGTFLVRSFDGSDTSSRSSCMV